MKPANWPSGQLIALVCILVSSWMAFDLFLYSRNDHDMKLLALGAAISQIASVMATASTLLVGKVFDGGTKLPTPEEMPPGTKATSAVSVEGSPVPSEH